MVRILVIVCFLHSCNNSVSKNENSRELISDNKDSLVNNRSERHLGGDTILNSKSYKSDYYFDIDSFRILFDLKEAILKVDRYIQSQDSSKANRYSKEHLLIIRDIFQRLLKKDSVSLKAKRQIVELVLREVTFSIKPINSDNESRIPSRIIIEPIEAESYGGNNIILEFSDKNVLKLIFLPKWIK